MQVWIFSVINFIIILGLLVLAHEGGHYLATKRAKMRVDEFAIGMGPILARLGHHGETLFTIRWLPIGGFVKIAGMTPDEEDIEGGFSTKPWGQRVFAVFAGPLASILFGYIVFVFLCMSVGVADRPLPVVDVVSPNSEASRIGLKTGDRILAIDNQPTPNWDTMYNIVKVSGGKVITLSIKRGSSQIELKASPKNIDPLSGKFSQNAKIGFSPEYELKRLGPAQAFVFGSQFTVRMLGDMVGMFKSGKKIKENVGGPIAIVSITRKATEKGFGSLLMLAGSLSISLGFINLFPIPILDGGHILLLFVERLRGGRKLSLRAQVVVQYIGLVMIVGIFMSVMYLDIARIINHKMP